MENKIPNGWTACPLKDVVSSRKGKKPNAVIDHAKKGYDPYILIDELEGNSPRTYTNDSKIPRATEKDVLLVWDGSIGKCASGLSGAVGSTIVVLSPKNGLNTKYLEYFIKRSKNYITETSTGSGLQHVNKSLLKTLEIPWPPDGGQKRIVDKLDVLLTKVKDAQSRLDKIPTILGRFRQSILASAFSGKLTKEWRKKNKIDTEWQDSELGGVLADLKYGTAKKCFREKMKHTVLRIPNVVRGYIDSNDLKYADLDKKEYESLKLEIEDILLIRSNGSVSLVGRTALVTDKEKGMAYAGYLIRLRVNKDLIIPEFLQYQFQSYAMRLQIELPARSTSGVNNINSEEVRNLQIALPSLDEQREVVRRLKATFAFLEKNEQEFNKAKSYADKLEQSILAKAFRGELVSQDG
ncbi:MAG: restriction endonuclease subunit S [Candidatus Omnitrophica bacterium]|nr:restriction endonuclease subunit S [Candidatus Omnitrophota bacterium]MBU4478630.1 restriction endonuclease subunit S [Candidatus Omnitrophota bacterium]